MKSALNIFAPALVMLAAVAAVNTVEAAPPAAVTAELTAPTDSLSTDDSEIRENPVIEPDSTDDDYGEPTPGYIRHLPIEMNGDDWTQLIEEAANSKPFNIIHIGDSHLQADIATNITREMLQYDFGNAGRGLVAPLKLSGTNEPWNYAFKSDIKWTAERFMKPQWTNMGFTGCAITSQHPAGYIQLSTSDRNDWNPFNIVTIFHSGGLDVTSVTDSEGNELAFELIEDNNSSVLMFNRSERLVNINLTDDGPLTIYGAFLSSGHPGLTYNVIGNNGATYQSYNRIGDFADNLSKLNPHLIIISLGCNEAFGRFDPMVFVNQVDRLIKSIKASNPDAKLLLTTPMECHRRQTTYGSRRKGKRRSRTTSFTVNQNVAPVRNALLRYGRSENIPVYDLYEAAGGQGSSNRWVDDGLFSKDHIHLSAKGYHLMGRLLYEAIANALKYPLNDNLSTIPDHDIR